MISILSLKTPLDQPIDAIDTVNHNIFRCLSGQVNFMERKTFWQKVSVLRKIKPDYMLGIGVVEEIFYFPFKPARTKYVIAWHTILRKTITLPVRRILFQRAAFIIAVSDCAARSVKKYFPSKPIFKILNGVDTDFFNPDKRDMNFLGATFGLPRNKPVILFVGAMFQRKRPDVFIKIAKNIPEASFVLVGRKDKQDFISHTKDLKNFYWLPFASHKEVSRIMASSDIFLFPSIDEPCAAVIVEAMASGLPCVLSDSCGNSELIINGKDGFLVKPQSGELEKFAALIRELISDKALHSEITRNAREKCLNSLNWPSVAVKYLGAFNEFNEAKSK